MPPKEREKLSELFKTCLNVKYRQVGVRANYAVIRDGVTLYVFFQGSDGAVDWKNNLDFPARIFSCRNGELRLVHRGFLRVWREIEPHLTPIASDPSVRRIVVSGYSHGGALAVLCHDFLLRLRPDLSGRIKSYGFGCPRVLWGIKSKKVAKRWADFTVVRNGSDIVTHLPPVIMGYFHVGRMLKIGKRRGYSPVSSHFGENILRELIEWENQSQDDAEI